VLVKWMEDRGFHHQKVCLLTRVPACDEYIVFDEDTRHECKVIMVVHIAQPLTQMRLPCKRLPHKLSFI
jgi:hypothetical protein